MHEIFFKPYKSVLQMLTQSANKCSKLTTETLEQGGKQVQS